MIDTEYEIEIEAAKQLHGKRRGFLLMSDLKKAQKQLLMTNWDTKRKKMAQGCIKIIWLQGLGIIWNVLETLSTSSFFSYFFFFLFLFFFFFYSILLFLSFFLSFFWVGSFPRDNSNLGIPSQTTLAKAVKAVLMSF